MRAFYLAGPFFTDEQKRVMGLIEHHCRTIGLPVFSPRLECLCPPDAPPEQRTRSFQANVEHIRGASFVLARIDDFDPGTMWELGYAYAWAAVKVYAFSTIPGRGLNLMIAESGAKFISGLDEVLKFLEDVRDRGDFGRALAWKKEIV